MHPKTTEIAENIRKIRDNSERFANLKHVYEDSKAILVTCGPSFSVEEFKKNHQELSNHLIIAVKQSYSDLEDIADFHLYNPVNHTKYHYNPTTIRFLTHCPDPERWKTFGPKPDLEAHMESETPKVYTTENDWLISNRNFDQYRFDCQIERPWGPGIMIESALYFALHLGVKRLACVGWDVSQTTQGKLAMPHYYEKSTKSLNRVDHLVKGGLGKLKSIFPSKCHPHIRTIRNYYDYCRGNRYNQAKVYPNENPVIWAGSYNLYSYFKSKGMEIELLSDQSRLDERIPRNTLESFLG